MNFNVIGFDGFKGLKNRTGLCKQVKLKLWTYNL